MSNYSILNRSIFLNILKLIYMVNRKLKIIGIQIKAERLKNNLSQEDLAEITNISIPTISLIETGKQNTSILNIIEIAKALKCDINVLIQGVYKV